MNDSIAEIKMSLLLEYIENNPKETKLYWY